MQFVGAHPIGGEPVAGDPLWDPPSVVVTFPTSGVSTGGPTLTPAWTYSQPQGKAQEQFRILVQNDAGTVTHHDTGWLSGAVGSYALDWDAIEAPTVSSDVQIVVRVRGPASIGTGTVARYEASDESEFSISWGNPQCAITGPVDGQIWTDGAGIDVAWTFTDPGKTQTQYRVRILEPATSTVLYSTGWVASAATSVRIPIVLSDDTEVQVEVQLKNNHGMRSE